MSREKFDPNCPGCRPVVIDPLTGRVMPEDSPFMQAVLKAYEAASIEEKECWHAVTCKNSRKPADMAGANLLTQRIQNALEQLEERQVH